MTVNDPTLSKNLKAGVKKNPGFKRRKILIKRSFQIKSALIMLVLLGAACFMVWWETYHSLTGLSREGIIKDPALLVMLGKISKIVLVKAGLFLGVAWILSIALTHYIAGPIYRFEKSFEALKSGDLTHRIHLRKGDELKFLGSSFNETMGSLQENIKSDRLLVEAVARQLDNESNEKFLKLSGDLRKVTKSFKI